uniref:Uncharacterized protein n=1 Tax=Physcomitrium patens TaxID=3218 RepID=A0A7I3ZHA3_PHYPA
MLYVSDSAKICYSECSHGIGPLTLHTLWLICKRTYAAELTLKLFKCALSLHCHDRASGLLHTR